MNALVANVMVANAGGTVERIIRARVRTPHAGVAKNIALAVAAPFIGLAFVVAFPLIGLVVLARMGARALPGRGKGIARFAKNIALFLAGPFVGLAYALAFPFIGAGMVAWMGVRALANRPGRL